MDHRDLLLSIRRANILGGSWQDEGYNTLSLNFSQGSFVISSCSGCPAGQASEGAGQLFDQGSQGVEHALGAVLRSIRNLLDEASALIDGFVANGCCEAGGKIFLWISK
jgi:hypothetical protein